MVGYRNNKGCLGDCFILSTYLEWHDGIGSAVRFDTPYVTGESRNEVG